MSDKVAKELDHVIGDDGSFYMAIEDFHKHFTSYGVTYNPEGWHHAYHLELDDKGQGAKSA